MGNKYSTQSVSSYNNSPPADDGSQVGANQVKWATIKTKLGDPLNTFASAINSALLSALDQSCSLVTTNYTTVAGDHLKPLQVSGASLTISLGDAATMAVGYIVIIYNAAAVGATSVTVGLATAGNTLDGTAAGTTSIQPKSAKSFIVNQAANGYNTVSGGDIYSTLNNIFTGTNTFNKEIILGSSAEVATANTLQLVGNPIFHIPSTGSFIFKAPATGSGADRFKVYAGDGVTGGVVSCSTAGAEATGGPQGNGTCNFTGVYENSNRVYSSGSMVESSELSAAAGAVTLSHGFGSVPKIFKAILRCKTAEAGYSIGDEIDITSLASFTGTYNTSTWVNTSVVGLAHGNSYTIVNQSTQANFTITDANWRIVLRAWK